MHKVPLGESLRIIGRGTVNWFSQRPLVVSFEVTNSCTCWCKHCDHGGPKDNSKHLKPTDYRRYTDRLKPAVVQISGGEPLLRRDVVDIVKNIKCNPGGLPYTILVSNWALEFKPAFAGWKYVHVSALDDDGHYGYWQKKGTWEVTLP